jgi:hypothetical protein
MWWRFTPVAVDGVGAGFGGMCLLRALPYGRGTDSKLLPQASKVAAMADMPVAFFITFRAYGTWLPGDARGSIGWRQNATGSPPLQTDKSLELRSRGRLKGGAANFDAASRNAILEAIREVCSAREWELLALNVRTNHVHVVVQCDARPERAMIDFKAYATRRLVRIGAFPAGGGRGQGTAARGTSGPNGKSIRRVSTCCTAKATT